MLKKHAQFFESPFFISDLLTLSLGWVLSYYLKMSSCPDQTAFAGNPSLSNLSRILVTPLGHMEFCLK